MTQSVKTLSGCKVTFKHDEKSILFNPLFLVNEMNRLVESPYFAAKAELDFLKSFQKVANLNLDFNPNKGNTKANYVIDNTSFFYRLCAFSHEKNYGLRISSWKDDVPYFEYFKFIDRGKLVEDMVVFLFTWMGKSIPKVVCGSTFLFTNSSHEFILLKKDADSFFWIGSHLS